MNLKDIYPPFQIRLFHHNTAIKPPRPQKCRIKNLRPVRRSQEHQSFVALKSVHLSQKLVERLLPLIIAAHLVVTALSDGINLVDKDNTRSHLLRLLEQVAHTGSPDSHIHLHKRRTAERKERNIRFARNRFCKQRLSGSRRPYEQCAFRQFRPDAGILPRIMQKIHNLLQRLLRFFLPRNILKRNAGLFLHIHLGIALSNAHHASALRHLPSHIHEHADDKRYRKESKKHIENHHRSRIRYLMLILHPSFKQAA